MVQYITRKKKGSIFEYYTHDNKKITDKNILERINKIYIAPAYKDVKIYLNGDILATGIDAAGRKQYIYSDNMKKKREIKKFNKLIHISDNIDKLKKKIKKDLSMIDFTKDKLIALVLKIMDLCNFRGGNKKYEEKYGSYGITTIHKKHISIKKNSVEIDFIGKKGVNNHCIIQNKEIQDIIKKVYNMSSKDDQYIFSINYKNEPISLTLLDVNKYLENFDITTKDLRTWNANVIFLKNLKNEVMNVNNSTYNTKTEQQKINIRKKLIREAIKKTAILLHHTPSICKSSYIYKKLLGKIEDSSDIIKDFKKKTFDNNENIEEILKKYLYSFKRNIMI